MNYELYISVHEVVDTILRRGHLDTRIFNQASMNEGSALHRIYQDQQNSTYQSEVSLDDIFQIDDFICKVSGKADGLFFDHNIWCIEEIKTTNSDLESFISNQSEWHLGQAMFYAYFFAKRQALDRIQIILTYISQINFSKQKRIIKQFSFDEISNYVNDIMIRYVNFIKKIKKLKDERNESWKEIPFPFKDYRKGQKRLIDFVNKAQNESRNVYIEAPTGIGKTVSVLYPSLKRFASNEADHIFYLTSKNSIKKIAVQTLKLFSLLGSKARCIEFTSKENICFNDKKGHCNPDECPFAQYFYDKILTAVIDGLYANEILDKNTIKDICYAKQICPYYFQFEIAKYSDVLICDYSYVFNYASTLKFLDDSSETKDYLLIDECHNLPDRVRDIFSAEITLDDIKKAYHLTSGEYLKKIHRKLNKLKKLFLNYPIDSEKLVKNKDVIYEMDEIPLTISNLLNDILLDFKSLLRKNPYAEGAKFEPVDDKLMEFFYKLIDFEDIYNLSATEEDAKNFCFYFILDSESKPYVLRIANIASKPYIKQTLNNFQSSVFFSATLSPKEYYIDLLGGDNTVKSNILLLESPFPKERCKVLIDTSHSLKYEYRKQNIGSIYEFIKASISAKKGNYFIYCPSYEYLNDLRTYFDKDDLNIDILYQTRQMSDTDKEIFLSSFREDNIKTTVGVLVLGGVFSEGIDLTGNRLIGSIIISVGIPQINFESDKIKSYYQDEDIPQKGYLYAYAYPGFNRVLQAAGRVIRTPIDKGFIFFIDQRFNYKIYKDIIKEIFPQAIKAISPSQVKATLTRFFEEEDPYEL